MCTRSPDKSGVPVGTGPGVSHTSGPVRVSHTSEPVTGRIAGGDGDGDGDGDSLSLGLSLRGDFERWRSTARLVWPLDYGRARTRPVRVAACQWT